MKRIVSLLVLSLMALTMVAVPAKKRNFTHTQSDGQQISLMMVGDEHMHYFVNTDTQEKMLQGENGDFYVVSNARIEEMQKTASVRMQKINESRLQRLTSLRESTLAAKNGPRKVGEWGTMSGEKKGLVILVNFSDKSMSISEPQTAFNNQFNEEGYSLNGHIGSVHDYFYDQSYGQLDLDFDVVGPIDLSKQMSYYGGNNSSGNDKHPGEMVIEALNAIDDQVNFADYDWDGDGEVDQVYVIYAGYGEHAGGGDNTIWPHEWELTSCAYYSDGNGAQYLDGVRINTYACSCELTGTWGTSMNGIGTACHEFSHCLGYPDFYDTDYSGGVGMDSFDVMCGGSYNGPNYNGEVPCGYTSYERWMAGWLEPTVLSDNGATITDMDALNDSPVAYVIYNEGNRNEYFLLENRQAKGWFKYFDNSTAGHGLFITHVDYDATAWAYNTPNDNKSHQRMSWIAADGSRDSYSPKGDFFPGTGNKTALTNTSHENAGAKLFNKNTDDSYYMNHELTEIEESNGKISFLFDGGEIIDDGNRYTITYNPGTGECEPTTWTQTEFREKTTLPEITTIFNDWEFVGWCVTEYGEQSTDAPTEVLAAGSAYRPESDITFHAVYKKMEMSDEESGSYTLNYSEETELQGTTLGYSNPVTYTALDGSTWVVKAYKSNGLQINKGRDASIKVPECPAKITTIEVTGSQSKAVKFSDTDYTGNNSPTAYATSAPVKNATLDLNGKQMSTGYIYTTEGATVISKIVVNYGPSITTYYYTYPDESHLVTPTITFEVDSVAMFYGDEPKVIAATVTDSEGEVTYSSSNTKVVTVDAQTGEVTAVGAGEAIITAVVASVPDVSRSVSASYVINVTMPALVGLEITTPPNTTTYWEGERFSTKGMVVSAVYENGYKKTVKSYSANPKTSQSLTADITEVIISYTENGVTVTATVAITVNERPKYTVTFDAGSGTCDVESESEASYQGGVVLPSATGINENWIFAGWFTESLAETTECPENLLKAGQTYAPVEDTTLYAVYSYNDYYASNPNGVDDLAGIREISIDALANGRIYNLNGQRVSVPVRGQIYILNGAKFIAK